MTTDPAKRSDGLCARPGCTNRLVPGPPKSMPKTLRTMFLTALAGEPFCSTNCCREWHGAPTTTTPATSLAAPERIAKHFGTAERRAYRDKHKVPCERGCGTQVEGRGRSRGKNPDRPFLCITCYRAGTKHGRAA